MIRPLYSIAADLGANSGRVMLGEFDGSRLQVNEVGRFPNLPVFASGTLYWDILDLYQGLRNGLRAGGARAGGQVATIGIDSWGNDFGLLDRAGNLIANPVNCRDNRTLGMPERVFAKIPKQVVFGKTGIQILRMNALYQLYSMAHYRHPALEIADRLLLIPDLLLYFLTGVAATEFSSAIITQMFDPLASDWARGMLDSLGVPSRILTEIVRPGTVRGQLTESNREELGLGRAVVTSVVEHDTGSAVAAVPAQDSEFAFISSGTWSLMGVETSAPIITEASYKYNFTNEGGAFGTYRLLKNIAGMWLVNESLRAWQSEGERHSFAELEDRAWRAEPFARFIDPDDESFVHPPSMLEAITQFCVRTGQRPPHESGEIIRCIKESLALKYRLTLRQMEEVTGRSCEVIHIIGGGADDRMHCTFAASATGRVVRAGPVEATAIGNLLIQVATLGEIGSLVQVREVVKKSFPLTEYQPADPDAWAAAYDRFLKVLAHSGD